MMQYRFVCLLLISAVVNGNDDRPVNDDRIVGGVPAKRKFAYLVSIETTCSVNCGGSIITPYWVLTSASCISSTSSSSVIRAGSKTWGSGGVTYKIYKKYQHPDFAGIEYDAGLIQISTVIIFNQNVQPIELSNGDPAVGTTVTIAGWGKVYSGGYYSGQLLEANMTVVSRTSCDTTYNNVPAITANMMCAGGRYLNFCDGDLGDPLVGTIHNVQVGIASFVTGCGYIGAVNYPGVYTNVGASAVRNWIASVAGV